MTTEEIYALLAEDFQERAGLSGGCSTELSIRFYAVAAQLAALERQCLWVRDQCFPQTATGEQLDHHAALRGLSRREAVSAEGVLRFLTAEPAATDLEIPQGTVCMTGGQVEFVTLEDGTLLKGNTQAYIPAQAVKPGSGGNVEAGTILTMTAPPVGISACTNPAPFTGGRDREEDEALRQRILSACAPAGNGGNAAWYRQAALSVPGVAAARVLPRSRGIGTVDVVIAGESGAPSEELVETVRETLEAQREIGVDVLVRTPETKAVDISALVKLSPGAVFSTVAVQAEAAIRGYFTGALLGQPVLLAKLGALLFAVDGVENERILSPTTDLAADDGVLPVLGSLTLTEWEAKA